MNRECQDLSTNITYTFLSFPFWMLPGHEEKSTKLPEVASPQEHGLSRPFWLSTLVNLRRLPPSRLTSWYWANPCNYHYWRVSSTYLQVGLSIPSSIPGAIGIPYFTLCTHSWAPMHDIEMSSMIIVSLSHGNSIRANNLGDVSVAQVNPISGCMMSHINIILR